MGSSKVRTHAVASTQLDLEAELRERGAVARLARETQHRVGLYTQRVWRLHRSLRRASNTSDKIRRGSGNSTTHETCRWGRRIWVAARRWHTAAEQNDANRDLAGTLLPASMLSKNDLRDRPVPVEGLGFKVGLVVFTFAQTANRPAAVVKMLARYRKQLGSYDGPDTGVRPADTELGIAGFLRQLDRYFEGSRWSPPPAWVAERPSSGPSFSPDRADRRCFRLPKPRAAPQQVAASAPQNSADKPPLAKPKRRRRVSTKVANQRVAELLRNNPRMKTRELARGANCAHGLISELPAYRAVRDAIKQGRKPRFESLTTEILERTAATDGNEFGNPVDEQANREVELACLVDDQQSDEREVNARSRPRRRVRR